MKHTTGLTVLLLALSALPAAAQEKRSQLFLGKAGNSTADRSIESTRSLVEVTASKDSSKATLKIGNTLSDKKDDHGRFTTWSLAATAPVSKSDDKTELATLDGLANSFTLGFDFTRFSVEGMKNPKLDILVQGKDVCDRTSYVKSLCNVAKANRNLFEGISAQMRESYVQQKLPERLRTVTETDPVKKTREEVKIREEIRKEAEELVTDTDNVKTYAPERYSEFRSLFWDPRAKKSLWGLSTTVGYENFDFFEAGSFEKESTAEVPWSVKAYVGFIPAKAGFLITIGAEYQNGYKDAENSTLCDPVDDGPLLDCETGPVGGPVDDNKELAYLEWRRKLKRAGLSLKLTYDFEDDVFGVDLPLYLLTDADNNLTGGIRFGWRDDTEDLTIGVFVGSAFSVF